MSVSDPGTLKAQRSRVGGGCPPGGPGKPCFPAPLGRAVGGGEQGAEGLGERRAGVPGGARGLGGPGRGL